MAGRTINAERHCTRRTTRKTGSIHIDVSASSNTPWRALCSERCGSQPSLRRTGEVVVSNLEGSSRGTGAVIAPLQHVPGGSTCACSHKAGSQCHGFGDDVALAPKAAPGSRSTPHSPHRRASSPHWRNIQADVSDSDALPSRSKVATTFKFVSLELFGEVFTRRTVGPIEREASKSSYQRSHDRVPKTRASVRCAGLRGYIGAIRIYLPTLVPSPEVSLPLLGVTSSSATPRFVRQAYNVANGAKQREEIGNATVKRCDLPSHAIRNVRQGKDEIYLVWLNDTPCGISIQAWDHPVFRGLSGQVTESKRRFRPGIQTVLLWNPPGRQALLAGRPTGGTDSDRIPLARSPRGIRQSERIPRGTCGGAQSPPRERSSFTGPTATRSAPICTVAPLSDINVNGKRSASSLEWAPRKKPEVSDPLVHHGRHFGRAVYAFANVHALLLAGLAARDGEVPPTAEERRERRVYVKLVDMVPSLEDLLHISTPDKVSAIATMIQKGANSARSDDTRSLKSAVIDWIALPMESLSVLTSHGIAKLNVVSTTTSLVPSSAQQAQIGVTKRKDRSALRNKELIAGGTDWPVFLYQNEKHDPEDPWRGLFRGRLLVKGFKHVFVSPSSAEDTDRATRAGNARLHGMTRVTPASIAYIATQVRFALSSASTFCRTDKEGESELFYHSILEVLEDPDEVEEVKALLAWWDRKVFPAASNGARIAPCS
ncbi:hypothetical protein NMY22_g11433 [Coprinellus aureogranulatus]|nr:hypothetical protein NMY22_g11433 [Coprinellus aureogranulatus]